MVAGKTMKRWAFSIAPNGLVFTSSYKKSSLLSMMDETERTHGSNNSSDSDDYSDDSDDEDTYLVWDELRGTPKAVSQEIGSIRARPGGRERGGKCSQEGFLSRVRKEK